MYCNPLCLLISFCNVSSDFLPLKLWLKWSRGLGNSLDPKHLIISDGRDAARNMSDKKCGGSDLLMSHGNGLTEKKSPVVTPKPQPGLWIEYNLD